MAVDTSWNAFIETEAQRWLRAFQKENGRNPTWYELVAANLIEPVKAYIRSMTGLTLPAEPPAAEPPAAERPAVEPLAEGSPAEIAAGVPAGTLTPGSSNFDPRAYYQEYPEMYAQRGLEQAGYTAGPFTRFLQGQLERPTAQFQLLQQLRAAMPEKYGFPAGGTFAGPLEQFNWLLGGGDLNRNYFQELADISRRGGLAGATPEEIATQTYVAQNPQDIWNYYQATQPRQFGPFGNWLSNQYGNIYGRFVREQAVPGGGTKSWIDYLLGR